MWYAEPPWYSADSTSATRASLASCRHISPPLEWGSKYAFILYKLPSLGMVITTGNGRKPLQQQLSPPQEWMESLQSSLFYLLLPLLSSPPLPSLPLLSPSSYPQLPTVCLLSPPPVLEAKSMSLPSYCVHSTSGT